MLPFYLLTAFFVYMCYTTVRTANQTVTQTGSYKEYAIAAPIVLFSFAGAVVSVLAISSYS